LEEKMEGRIEEMKEFKENLGMVVMWSIRKQTPLCSHSGFQKGPD
jgi:hypothetical protein